MQLRYYDPVQAGSTASYTGNISEWSWKTGANAGADRHTYAFTYDPLSRLTDTRQFVDGVQNDQFVERGMNYDRNGNILSLQRYAGGQVVNDFAYSYDGNMLVSLTDEGDEGVVASGSSAGSTYTYEYDANGNMTYDGANDLSLSYNHLNLIEKVARDGVTLANYSYLADGTKLSATDADGNGLVYAGSLVYRKQDGNLSLESGAFPEGRFVATDSGIETHYHLTDHLGSVRATVKVGFDEDGFVYEQLQEVNNFYPFGMRWVDPNQPTSDNRYRYNGKEEQNFLNLPFIDYGWRHYDAKHGRWFGLDRLAGSNPRISPFAFCGNDPINKFDSDGQREWPVNPTYNNGQRHVSSSFQTENRPRHNGVDIGFGLGNNNAGASILATHDGTVTRLVTIGSGDTNAGGTRMVVTSTDGTVATSFMHMEGIIDGLSVGSTITEGQQIGTMGGSGNGELDQYTPHLHYEIRVNGELQNPENADGTLVDPQALIAPVDGGPIEPVVVEDERERNRNVNFPRIRNLTYDNTVISR